MGVEERAGRPPPPPPRLRPRPRPRRRCRRYRHYHSYVTEGWTGYRATLGALVLACH